MTSLKSANPARLEDLLTYRLHVVKKLTDRVIHEEFIRHSGLSLPEARVMLCVGAFGRLSVSELGQKSNLDRSQASRAADALVRRDLLEKTASASDGRGVAICLSAAGGTVYRKVLKLSQQRNAEFLALLAPAQAQGLLDALDTLITALRGSDEA